MGVKRTFHIRNHLQATIFIQDHIIIPHFAVETGTIGQTGTSACNHPYPQKVIRIALQAEQFAPSLPANLYIHRYNSFRFYPISRVYTASIQDYIYPVYINTDFP